MTPEKVENAALFPPCLQTHIHLLLGPQSVEINSSSSSLMGYEENNNPTAYIPLYGDMQCLKPSVFCLNELDHDSSAPFCFRPTRFPFGRCVHRWAKWDSGTATGLVCVSHSGSQFLCKAPYSRS